MVQQTTDDTTETGRENADRLLTDGGTEAATPVEAGSDPDADQEAMSEEEKLREKVVGRVYEVPLRNNDGQLEATMPSDLVAFHGYENGDPVAFTPRVDGGEIVFDLTDGDGRHRNERRIRKAGEYGQVFLRFPKEIADERGLFELVEEEDEVLLGLKTTGERQIEMRTWPTTRPAFFANAGQPLAEPAIKTLVEFEAGQERDGERITQLRFEIPKGWGGEDVLDLRGGEKVATRLTSRNGELNLALDLRVDGSEYDKSNVRTIYSHDIHGNEDGEYITFRVTFSKTYAHALGLHEPGTKTSMKVTPEEDRMIFERFSVE